MPPGFIMLSVAATTVTAITPATTMTSTLVVSLCIIACRRRLPVLARLIQGSIGLRGDIRYLAINFRLWWALFAFTAAWTISSSTAAFAAFALYALA